MHNRGLHRLVRFDSCQNAQCWKSNVAVQMKNCYIKFSFEVWYIKVASLAPMVSVTIDYL